MAENKVTINKIAYLDGLRGIAILLVVVFHFWELTWLNHTITTPFFEINLNHIVSSGFVGVEAFFFLSGFCLFLPHAKSMIGNYQLRGLNEFIYKRVIKIVPSYVLCIVLILWLKDIPFESPLELAKTIAAHMFFANNFFSELPIINGVLWSLAVEIQFYMLFPAIAYVFRRGPILTCLAIAAIAISYRMYFLYYHTNELHYYMHLMPASLDLFAFGMLGAYLSTKYSKSHHAPFLFKVGLTILTIIMTVVFLELLRWYFNISQIGGTRMIWLAYHRSSLAMTLLLLTVSGVFSINIWHKIMANKILVFLGVISYNLYIWHLLIARYFYHNNIIPSAIANPREDLAWQLLFMITAFAVSVAFASFLTFYFERPFMKLGFRGVAVASYNRINSVKRLLSKN